MYQNIESSEKINLVAEYQRDGTFGVVERPSFTTNLADMLGIKSVRVDMRRLTNRKQAFKAWKAGVEINGVTYAIVTASSAGKSKRFTAFDLDSIAEYDLRHWFGPKNVMRLGAILTPIVAYGRLPATVLIVDKDDHRYGNDDGQAVISCRLAIAMENPDFDQDQDRMVFPELKGVGKGTTVVNPRLDAEGIDLVMDAKFFKTENPDLGPGTMFATTIEFGIVERFSEPGWGEVGYQVAEKWPEALQDLVDFALPRRIEELAEAMQSPETFIKASTDLPVDMKQRDMLQVFADLCLELGDNRLLYSNPFTALVEELMSLIATNIAVNGGIRGRMLASRGLPGVPAGIAFVHPSAGIPEGEAVIFRNPHAHAGQSFTAKIHHATTVRVGGYDLPLGKGSIGLGLDTGLASGRDQDGDKLVILSHGNTIVNGWIDWVRAIQVHSMDNGRAPEGHPPQTLEEALDRIANMNVGSPANMVSNLIVLKTKYPDMADEAKRHFLKMLAAMQAAVDVKHWPELDEGAIKAARAFVQPYLTEHDTNWRVFANGRLRAWTHNKMERTEVLSKFEGTAFADLNSGLRQNKIIDPKDYVSNVTPIGNRMVLGDWPDLEWPVRKWATLPNAPFLDFIPKVEGVEHDGTVILYKRTVEALRNAHSLPDKERDREIQAVLAHFGHMIGIYRDADEDVREQVASALWFCGFRHERSEGRLMMRGMLALGVDVFVKLVRANHKEAVTVYEGIAYGAAPERYLEGDWLVKITDPDDPRVTDTRGQRVQKMFFGREGYLMVQPGRQPVQGGMFQAKLTRLKRHNGTPASRAQFILVPASQAEKNLLS